MHIQYTNDPPKKLHWKIEVDGRNFSSEEEILDVVRNVVGQGTVFYNRINFGERGKTLVSSCKKKNFTDGYWVYCFWFPRKKDAALFKLLTMA